MLTTKDLIESLSKYPEGTEWEIVGDRCIASELGVIDLEAMVGNDLGANFKKDHKDYSWFADAKDILDERG